MKILVTGGAGFIGSHLVDAYIAAGHDVAVVDNLSSGAREQVNPKARFVRLDIRDAALGDLFRREKFDVVNHHAAQMDVRRSVADPAFDASVNILGGLNVFENARATGVRTVIFASTGGAIYGEQEQFPATEDHPTRPLSPYGITKLTSEKYLFYYREVFGMNSVVLRYANIYGPRQNPHGEAGVVAIFCNKMLAGQQPLINGDGLQTRDYTYVGDVVKANLLALEVKGSNLFNVGTGVETDVNTLFGSLKRVLGSSCREEHAPAKAGEQRRSVISYQKIQKELAWRPEIGVQQGLEITANYFKLNVKRAL